MTLKLVLLAPLLAAVFSAHAAPVSLGSYTFDSAAFGDTLTQSDGGARAATSWLNTVNVNPGSPGLLTGANFETGIANIGFRTPPVTYTIGYNVGFVNGAGFDLGVVVARFSTDPFIIALSEDGLTFTTPATVAAASAHATGVSKRYFYGGDGPYLGNLFVHEIDLSDYGFAAGTVVKAVSITGTTELDLIRAAGVTAAVPEPGSWALMAFGLAALGLRARRRQR